MSAVEPGAATRVRSAAMRLALALTLALAACGGETSTPAPSRCTPGTSQACACASGSGVRPCLADGTYGGCSCPMLDAGAVDVTAFPDVPCGGLCGAGTACESGRCVPVDAGGQDVSAADARDATTEDVETRCTPNTLAYCVRPNFGGSCIDLQTNAMHCGACNSPCPAAAAECIAGRCTVARDAGR